MTFGERCRGVQKFIHHHLFAPFGQFALQVVASRPHLSLALVGHDEHCRGVGGQFHMPLQAALFFLPTADDFSVDALVGSIDIVDFIDTELWCHPYAAEARLIGGNAGHAVVEPRKEVAQQHDMVAAVHLRRGGVAVPQFPDGGGAMLRHVAPRRVGLVGGQQPRHVGAPHFGQGVHEPADADDAARHMAVVVGNDVADDVFGHFLFHLRVVNHSEDKGQDVGRSGVVAIKHAVGVEQVSGNGRSSLFPCKELAVEGGAGVGGLLLKIGAVGVVP